jgi:hypothetical protein
MFEFGSLHTVTLPQLLQQHATLQQGALTARLAKDKTRQNKGNNGRFIGRPERRDFSQSFAVSTLPSSIT